MSLCASKTKVQTNVSRKYKNHSKFWSPTLVSNALRIMRFKPVGKTSSSSMLYWSRQSILSSTFAGLLHQLLLEKAAAATWCNQASPSNIPAIPQKLPPFLCYNFLFNFLTFEVIVESVNEVSARAEVNESNLL